LPCAASQCPHAQNDGGHLVTRRGAHVLHGSPVNGGSSELALVNGLYANNSD
jgi:hypothetical protein